MASSDSGEDSEGENLSTIRPALIRELRNVLDLYPDDGQILKELIQNAEDAGASIVRVLADKRRFHQQLDPKTLRKHPHLKFFQGPALCVYNDAEFSQADWKGIRMLHTSIKEEDPLKVGRFGLGFKSIFHLTDRLVIVSGEYIMYMDPFKGEDHYCKRHRVAGRKGRELQSILTSLDGVFGVSQDTFREGSGRFPGTLFWFPLRQSASDLSSTVYGEHSVEDLLASFRAEAPSLLLFLKHTERVEIVSRTDTGGLEDVFSVGIAPSCLKAVRSERRRFVADMASAGGDLPLNETYCTTEVVMETRDHARSSSESQRWLVVTYHSGQRQTSDKLKRLCSDPQLSYRPYVGVAIPLTNQDSFQSQIFCFLPLPLDTRSPTGLPLHVHGYFALEQNRRHVKWPPADKLTGRVQPDLPSMWNCLLVTELLPRVYRSAILRLRELNVHNPEAFYTAWPDVSSVHDRWRPLLQPLYQSLAKDPIFFSRIKGGQWVSLQQAVLQSFSPPFSREIEEAVVKVYTASQENLVELPGHLHDSLKKFKLLKDVKIITASRVSQLIPPCLPKLSRSEKLGLLHFLRHHDVKLLLNQQLLPLADGKTFGTFTKRQSQGVSPTFWCSDQLVQLFPGLEVAFCNNNVHADVKHDLCELAKSGKFSLEQLHSDDPRIPKLLQESMKKRFGGGSPSVHKNDPWIKQVWQHLSTVADLRAFTHVPLMPVKMSHARKGHYTLLPLGGIYVCSSAVNLAPLSSPLASALTRLGVTILQDLPDFVTRHRHVLEHFVNSPSTRDVLTSIKCVNDSADLRSKAIKSVNANATKEERRALVQFLSEDPHAYVSRPSLFRQLKLFTNASTKQATSVHEVPRIGPDDLPPISLPEKLLACNDSERPAALSLGATEVTLTDLVSDILQKLSSNASQWSKDEVITFMMFFLNNYVLMADSSLLSVAREVRFVKTGSGELKMAEDVYDPTSSLLQGLFQSQQQRMFPHGDFAQPGMIKKLKKLGLRNEQSVKKEDIINTAGHISSMPKTERQTAKAMSHSLLKYLQMYGDVTDRQTLQTISGIRCLPCLQDGDRPKDYPSSLPMKSTSALDRPSEMNTYALLSVTGSVVPTLVHGLSEGVTDCLQMTRVARPDDVLKHLKNVIQHFRPQETSKYKLILDEIFQFFAQYTTDDWMTDHLQGEKCILVESGDQFSCPENFWIRRSPGDIDLRPYRFPLPVEMMELTDLMETCGSSQDQNELVLHGVLSEIRDKHAERSQHPDFHTDFQLVKQILDALKRCDTARDGTTLLPVVHHQKEVLGFMPARECTIMPGPTRTAALAYVGFEIYYVHPDISTSTALALGASLMKDRALTGVEDLDYGYGQDEDLTSRLHGLLKESYTDGFSVPKELIQNADDAGATKVCFLLDERENLSSRSNLIAETMATLQGPAIWAYNDAVFSESDFENIVKLGAGTKKEDTSKVGRFGLGFNAVYNLTDVPCFLSGTKLAMFDPQVKYLGKGKGLQLDFTKPVNKALLGRMPEQFEPFQGVFGCTLKSSTDTNYRGTLFRFPLRTAEQAVDSKLKNDSYSERKRREFLKMLLDKAGSLLMFTQSVREVEVCHLPSHCSKPTDMKCLLTVRKTCDLAAVIQPQLRLANKTILQFMKDHWSMKNKDIRIQQRLKIKVDVTAEAKDVCDVEERNSVTHWQLAWASGIDKSAKMTQFHRKEGLVPIAAAATLLSQDGLIPLRDSPQGFYNTGHLFCFLPLPEEMVHVTLPVHINGTFALTSDRRGLMVQTEDDLESGDASWNPVLFGDPVVRAYLLLLELVKQEAGRDSDFGRYFDLWPKSSVPCLVDSFYQCLDSVDSRIFPVPGQDVWVSFSDAHFLQPDFRSADCGMIAWENLQRFWKGPGYLVDVPIEICNLMRDKGPPGLFQEKVITELAFYRDFLFPNLNSDRLLPEHRDALIHHALMQSNEQIHQLVRENPCIPNECSRQLRKPSELVHPLGQVAKLFLVSEGYFPQGQAKDDKDTKKSQTTHRVNFCDHNTLHRLSGLGMVTHDMPWDMVLERAGSVKVLKAHKETEGESVTRASHLIEYLSVRRQHTSEHAFENCPSEVKKSLSEMEFLPVLPRPMDWPFPWAGGGQSDSFLLASPGELYSDSLRNLVSCNVKLLDSKALTQSAVLMGSMRHTLKGLGVIVEEDYSNPKLLHCALEQLLTVAEHHNADCNNNHRETIQSVTNAVYAYLTKCLRRDETGGVEDEIHENLGNRSIVWTGTAFVNPSLTAFYCQYDCSPYLFQLDKSLGGYRACFKAVGVKDRFNDSDVLSVLETLNESHADEQLTDDQITLVSHLAQLLVEIVKTFSADQALDTTRVFLPDTHGFMQPACCLCVDDCAWLKKSDEMKFSNERISSETARLLGVKTKKRQDFDMLTEALPYEDFGQSEKLTTRIERLLQGYTFDSSLCKELIQNADDAGATEAKFIMDFRHLGTDAVPDNWGALQGPALCFFNNKSFTKEDMQGIQNLGVGSKAQDALKIGQFGVGFNSVFHITDVPSFWTREDDEKDVICVFDPNCQYVLDTQPNKPGRKFNNFERLKQVYPDFLSGYLDTAIDMTQSGTLFRFPLRTAEMARSSEIKKTVVNEAAIKDLLTKCEDEMSSCLLFLNNLRKIGIYSVKKDGTLERHFEVSRTVDDLSSKRLFDFKASLQQASKSMVKKETRVEDVGVFEAVVQSEVADSRGASEQWLTVHRVGFADNTDLSPDLLTEWRQSNFRLLPHGGVAVKLRETTKCDRSQKSSATQHQAFCILPLPVCTGLPMHVNGHFALDHETRRNLWDGGKQKDAKSEWNDAIALYVITPAYITALQHAKKFLFPAEGEHPDQALVASHLHQYHSLLPQLSKAKSEFWKKLMQEVYRTLARAELPVFPVTDRKHKTLEWMPAVRRDGFPGYFSDLTARFKANEQEQKPVVLSQGIPSQPTQKVSDDSKATEMETLLKRSNMKILETPFRVHDDFKASGVESVQQVTPQTVLVFLRSSGQAVGGRCCIENLPKPVTDTPLSSVDNVRKLVEFVCEDKDFLDSLDGLPLCLRASNVLYKFSSSEHIPKPIISEFSHLLPGSAEEFLHKCILKYFKTGKGTPAVLQEFTVPMLAERLHKTLKEPCLKAAKPCVFDASKFPALPNDKSWHGDLWRFLESQLKQKSTPEQANEDGALHGQPKGWTSLEESKGKGKQETWKEKAKSEEKDLRQKADEMLQSLHKWCLIPTRKKDGSQVKLMLYPVQDLHKVVDLSAASNQSNSLLWTILQELPLPFLDHVCFSGIASKLVASIRHPRALLHALASCADHLSAAHEHGRTILEYFSNNLTILKEACADQSELKKEMRSLPVFPAVGGRLVRTTKSVPVLCLQSDIPEEGLLQWSEQRSHPLVLLRAEFVPDELRKYLDLHTLTNDQFYSQYLLPTIDVLPQQAIATHMDFLRKHFFRSVYATENMTEEQKQLSSQLTGTAFILSNGRLHRAQDFYTPHDTVFKVMCSSESFPPKPYCNAEWKGLMTAAGMICEVTDQMFLAFARAVEREGSAEITEEVATKSQTLVEHLFRQEYQKCTGLLSDVRSIRFLLPLNWMTTNEGAQLAKIAQPFCEVRLVSFSESSFEQHLHLVWSSSCILDPVSDPRMYFFEPKQLQNVMAQLCLQQKAEKSRVQQHARNICQSLGEDKGRDIFASLAHNKRLLIIVMETLYRYLEDNAGENDIAALKGMKLICDIDNSQMLHPRNVVMDLRTNEMIKGHIEKAPHQFGRYFELFKKLGATECVTANHYAVVLSWLKGRSGNEPLDVEEMKIVKTAVDGLFRCLREGTEEQQKIMEKDLYLPTEGHSLQTSTELIFKDDYLGDRFKDPPDGMHFFLGFEKLKIKVSFAREDVKRLPKQHTIVMLSDIVQEVITDDVHRKAEDTDESNPLTAKLLHPLTVLAVVRLLYHEHKCHDKAFTEDTAREVEQKLRDISVKKVSGLKTVLTVHKTPVPDSEDSHMSFTHFIRAEECKTAVVYIDTKALKNWTGCRNACVHCLAIAIQFVLETKVDSYLLHEVLHNPGRAQIILDKARIAQCTFGDAVSETVFPPAGTFVPLKFHCHLNNSFFEFYKGEHVGFELFDPEIDEDPFDAPIVGEGNIPVYIYGIILEEVFHQSAENAGRLSRQYRVDLGPDWGRVKVSVIKLYKFVRKPRHADSSTAMSMVQHQEDPRADVDEPLEFRAVLREIRTLLTEAWQLPDRKDRNRVVKRLLLQWHPDKNLDNEEFSTRVTQAILHYVSLLDQGLTLPDDDDDDDAFKGECNNDYFSRPGSTFHPSFFANMHARGRRHRHDYDSEVRSSRNRGSRSRGHGRYGGTDSGPNPQPGESRRWFRQAQADVTAACDTSGICDRGHNWICYQCHQGVEKALKAVLFTRDANSFDNMCHDLPYLAKLIGSGGGGGDGANSELVSLVQQLEIRLGPHARMRYPDVLAYPRVPADVYSADDVKWARDLASQVLERVQRLLQG